MDELKVLVRKNLATTLKAFKLQEMGGSMYYANPKQHSRVSQWNQKFPELIVRVYGDTSQDVKRGGHIREVIAVSMWEALDHAWKYTDEMKKAVEMTGEFGADMVAVALRGMGSHRCWNGVGPAYAFAST